MNIRSVVALLCFALAPAVANAHPPLTLTDDAAVRAQLNASAHAFETHDLDALAKTFVNDSSLTIFEGGEVNNGWTDYRDNHIKPEMAEITSVQYSLSNIKAHIDHRTAWATFNYHIVGSTAKRSFDSNGIGTAILQKIQGRWLIVHWHSTRSPAPPKI
ncbi:MAG: nuclear transport factor 2 family protein [Candidatus Eremiobacteraeota bacterium]|nr:nuclear transport factor 2 family protein [Candidatus Eremiobacteraeota bacterium]